MIDEIKNLIKLQAFDSTIRALEQTRQRLDNDARAAEASLVKHRARLDKRRKEVSDRQREMAAKELSLKEKEQKIKDLKTQLNTAKTNKAYSAFQHEIAGLKADASVFEDAILQVLEQGERHEREIVELEAALAKQENVVAKKKQNIQEAQHDADARTAQIRASRGELAGTIASQYLSPYTRLLQKADGQAMVECVEFTCQGCKMRLTPNTVNNLQRGGDLVFCHSCGRILYLALKEG